jgi:hypothetical protein
MLAILNVYLYFFFIYTDKQMFVHSFQIITLPVIFVGVKFVGSGV